MDLPDFSDVSLTGRLSLKQDGNDFFDTGMVVVSLKPEGTRAWVRELLKMSLRTSSSSSATFGAQPGMLSGMAALWVLILRSVLLTLAGDRHPAWSPRGALNSAPVCCSVLQSRN